MFAGCRLSLNLFCLCMLATSTDVALSNGDSKKKAAAKVPTQKVPDEPHTVVSLGAVGAPVGGGMPRSKSKEYMDTALIINKGVEAYQNKQYPQASEFFKKAITGSSDTALLGAAYVNLGMCYSATKDYKKAIEFFKKSLDLQPDDSQTQLDLANALLLAGEYVQAKQLGLALLSRLKITDRAAVSLYTLMGNIALGTAKWADAVEAFAKTLEANKNYSPAYIGMGEAYNQLELFDESVAALKKAIAIDPAHGHALFSLGKVLLKAAGKVGNNETKNLLDSIYYTQKHMALGGPTTHALFNKAAALHRLANWAAALPLYREAQWRLQAINQRRGLTVQEDEMIQLIYHEGECLYRLQQYEAAADRYLRAAEERPLFGGAFQALASCYEATGNVEAAIEAGWSSVKALQAEVEAPGVAGGTPKFLRGDTQPWPAYHKLVESMIRGGRPLPEIWDAMHHWRRANKKWGVRPWMATVGTAKKLLNSYIAARLPPQRYLPRPAGAVVYLCCKGPEDLENMLASVRLLYRHFLRAFPYPVIVFYDARYLTGAHMRLIRAAGGPSQGEGGAPAAIRFEPVDISSVLPPTDRRCNWSYRGYCEMSRFFAGALQDMPALKDLDFVWRMDTDSFLLAPMHIDLFQGAANYGCAYAVATMSVEPSDVVAGLWETVEEFVNRNASSSTNSWWQWVSGAVPGQEADGGPPSAPPPAAGKACPAGLTCLARPGGEGGGGGGDRVLEEAVEGGKAFVTATESVDQGLGPIDDQYELHPLNNRKRILNTIMLAKGKSGKAVWNRLHFYNNFEISRLSFWRSPQYREYFDFIDKSGGIFDHRWGDSPIKSLAALLFLRDEQFCYVGDELTYMHQSWLPLSIPSPKSPEEGGHGRWARSLDCGVRRNESRAAEADVHVEVAPFSTEGLDGLQGFGAGELGDLDYSPSFAVAGAGLAEEGDSMDLDDMKCETCGRDTG